MKLISVIFSIFGHIKLNLTRKIREIKFIWLGFFKNINNLNHICGMWVLELEKFDWTSEEEPWVDDSESPISVPEPTSALGLLAIGAWGVIKALKIRFDRSALKKCRLG